MVASTAPTPKAEADDVRDRLLKAAGKEFAAKGFEPASVRAMCSAAGANVAAVKYYFGSKEGLYAAVWEAAVERTVSHKCMPEFDTRGGDNLSDPEAALQAFVLWFVDLMLYQDVRATPSMGHLLSHEMLCPTPGGIDTFMNRCCKPIMSQLRQIIRAMVGPRASDRLVRQLATHVIGLCVHPHQSREIQTRVGVPLPRSKPTLRRLALDISRFATAGIKAFAT